ncbi:energy transducer TonB [Silvibacterium sp.]|uniref:energy transducer TonB n=1 Tax=Silvibacterium sp. TaxID=1964179 RepID=UPI0039E46736
MDTGANEARHISAGKRRITIEPSLGSVASLLAHVLLLIAIFHVARPVWKPVKIRTQGGHAALLYWNAGIGTGAAQQSTNSKTITKPARHESPKNPVKTESRPALASPIPANTAPQQAASAGAAKSQNQAIGTGLSDEDATPAFPTFSPNPPVNDRSLLPSNETNIVVDVDVSADGIVLDEKLVRGLGNTLDQSVLDTVRSWHFHPATRNGSPVASVSELVFPMSPRYHA